MRETAKKIRVGIEDRQALEDFSKKKGFSPRVARRARAILLIADGGSPSEVAEELEWTPSKVIHWRERYRDGGVEAILDRSRPGAPRKYERGEVLERVKKLLEEAPPKGYGKWTGALLAEALNINRHVLWQLLRREGINLARKRSWCVSTDPEFARKASDIIGLYLNPPVNALVLCVDEKPQVQAIERQQGYVYSTDGKVVQGYQSTYKRHGTLNLFAALDVHSGRVRGRTTNSKKRADFLSFLEATIAEHEDSEKIHVILDNHSIHKGVDEWLRLNPKVSFHYTPTSASWMNQIEVWFSILSRSALDGFSARSPKDLANQIRKFIATTNKNPKPFVWRKREVKGAQLKSNIRNLIN
jgi:transposase